MSNLILNTSCIFSYEAPHTIFIEMSLMFLSCYIRRLIRTIDKLHIRNELNT